MEDDLLQLVYHIYKDTQYQIKISDNESLLLSGFCDLYMLINQDRRKINWAVFISKINELQLDDVVYFILSLLNKLLPMQVVEDCLRKMHLSEKKVLDIKINNAFANWTNINQA